LDTFKQAIDGTPLISIIMPMYNAEKYVSETISSIICQTYENWELIIVDDCSTDNSFFVAESFGKNDYRIHLYRNNKNLGAAETRNKGICYVKGDFLAFMDADDVWLSTKLEKQIKFMLTTNTPMCFTSYETIREDGAHRNNVHVPSRIDYRSFLGNTITCSHTIMFNINMIQADKLKCPCFDKSFDYPEDMVVWLQVLKTGVIAYGLDEILAKYRKHGNSRSSDMFKAIKRTWNAYRKIERLSIPYSVCCLGRQLFHAALKRI
jgi:teichuronic acid biosynthesis glycosyltransferase TuaG